MKGICFDMDGVLIDSMEYHAEAMYKAVNEYVNYPFDKKLIYLMEGMPGNQLVQELFRRNSELTVDNQLVNKIVQRKTILFKEIENSKPIEGAIDLINELSQYDCIKILVSGASKKEVEKILDKNIGVNKFDFMITGDDIEFGKPSPQPFLTALTKSRLEKKNVLVVENSPLGVKSAKQAGLRYIVTLNNTPLSIDDFKDYLPESKNEVDEIVFRDTLSSKNIILKWCGQQN